MSELPPGWTYATADQITACDRYALAIGPFGSNLKVSDYRSSGVPLVFVRNIRARAFGSADLRFVSHEKAESLRAHQVRHGDLLITKMGDPPGDAAIYPLTEPGIITADCIKLTPHPLIDVRYLLYAISTPEIQHQINEITQGVAQRKVSLDRFRKGISFPLAPLVEQKRVVVAIEEQFSRLDVGVAAVGRARKNLKRMRAAVLEAAVTGALIDVSSEEWEKVALGDLLDDIHAGKSFKCAERPANPDEWGVVKVSAMTWGDFREGENKTVVGDRTVDPRFEIRTGDLLVSRANTVEYVGAAVLVHECRPHLLLSDKSLRLVPNSRALSEWLLISLRTASARRYIESVATGTSDSMRNISQPKLKALKITLPPIGLQAQLVGQVDQMMSQIEQLEKSLSDNRLSAQALRSSILAAAFSGKLAAQDPTDEPASALLQRIAAEKASYSGRWPTRGRKPRMLREEVRA